MMRERFGVSERQACKAVDQPRSTQRLPPPVVSDDEKLLVEFLIKFSKQRPRWGWRRAAKQARRDGWDVNDNRVKRLWQLNGLRVPAKKRKKRLSGIGTHLGAMSPIRPNVLWALDFQFDTTVDGCTLKMLNVIDEFTRECLAIDVHRTIDANGVVNVLDRLTTLHGPPVYLRFDNGGEFIAQAVADLYRFNSVNTIFIDPGSPWQNAWIESFNGRLRDERLNLWRFDSLLEARVIIEDHRIDYNINGPHTAHGDLTAGHPTVCSRRESGVWTGSPRHRGDQHPRHVRSLLLASALQESLQHVRKWPEQPLGRRVSSRSHHADNSYNVSRPKVDKPGEYLSIRQSVKFDVPRRSLTSWYPSLLLARSEEK